MVIAINQTNKYKLENWIGYIILISISLLIGQRPINVGTDTSTYFTIFNSIRGMELSALVDNLSFGSEPIFNAILVLCSRVGDYTFALCIICFLMNMMYLKGSNLWAKNIKSSGTLLFLLILSSFTCWNQEINVIRNGLAISVMFVFLYYFFEGRKKKALVYGIIAFGIHFSTIIFIAIALLVKWIPKLKFKKYIWLYFIVLICSAIGFSVLSFGFLQTSQFEKAQLYTADINQFDYQVGFRPTFALFNTLFLLLFLMYRSINSDIQQYLIKLFIAYSCVFFMWFALPFSDRMGAYSWILIPVILFEVCSEYFKGRRRYGLYLSSVGYFIINFIISEM